MNKKSLDTTFFDKIKPHPVLSLFFSLMLTSPSNCLAQSYQLVLDSVGYIMKDFAVNGDNDAVLVMRNLSSGIEKDYYIVPVEESGGAVQGMEIPIKAPFTMRSVYHDDRIIFSTYGAPYHPSPNPILDSKSIIFNIDLASNTKWSKYLNGRIFQHKFELDANGNVLLANTPHNSLWDDLYNGHAAVLELFKLDEAGNTVWKKGLLLEDSLFAEHTRIDIRAMGIDKNSNIYLLGLYGDFSDGIPYIIKFDSTGHPLMLRTFLMGDEYLNEVQVVADGILLLNHAPKISEMYHSGIYHNKYAKLIKLDFDLNFLWGKQYSGENFPYYSAGIKEKPNGNLLMTHSTFGAYPAVLTEMDADGNILNQKGYPNYQPQIAVLDDGSFMMTSIFSYNEEGETTYQPVIAKSDIHGEIDGCETFPTCIIAEDFMVEFGTLNFVDTISIPDLEDFDTIIKPVTFSFSQGCNFPPVPIPDFHFPDTLCLADSARTTDTHNRLANAHEWHLTGPNVDSINMDSFDFGHRFQQAGEYILKHTVWVLGCSYSFEKNITVLPPLEVAIAPETLCPDNEEVMAVADRMLTTYQWNTGGISPTLPITASGMYSVQVSDGHCTATDTAEVLLVSDIIGFANPILLPTDTTVCEGHLPFLLEMESGYTDVFSVNGDSVFNGEHLLNTGGSYPVFAEVSGCPFTHIFSLETDDCKAAIYFPTVFSPNNDGINDVFFPQGKGFEAVALKVFDRWGGLLYDGAGSGAAWSPSADVSQGMYAYLFFYKNGLTGEVVQEAGEVVLVR